MAAHTRTTAVGTQNTSDFLSSAEYNDAAGGLIGYMIGASSNQTGITTATTLTNASITLTPSASRILKIEWCVDIDAATFDEQYKITVQKDSVDFDTKIFTTSGVNNDGIGCATGFCIDVGPTNASHTYRCQLGRVGTGSGTFNTRESATEMLTFLIWDCGPSF